MINIVHPNLNKLAIRHYQAVVDFLEKNEEQSVAVQNEKIIKCFGTGYNFRRILLATPSEMERLIENWDANNKLDFAYYKDVYDRFSSGKQLKTQDKTGKQIDYNALKLANDLGMVVCPYCNRNFIYNTKGEEEGEGRRTSQIDHFYPKANFPFLALSFYNLVPTCGWCNFVKGNRWNTESSNFVIHPYDNRFNFDVNFIVKVLDAKFYYETNSLEIDFQKDLPQRVENHIEAFHLKDLYAKHTDYALELIQKKYAYSESYIDSLFKQYEGTLFKNREDILRLVTGNFVGEENLSKRPLSKLTRDIVRQLDL